MTTIQIRIDEQTKKEAQIVLDEIGFDLSSAIKVYLKQIANVGGIPFPLLTENGFTPEAERKLIRESNATLRAYKKGKVKGYKSVDAMFEDVLGKK